MMRVLLRRKSLNSLANQQRKIRKRSKSKWCLYDQVMSSFSIVANVKGLCICRRHSGVFFEKFADYLEVHASFFRVIAGNQ